MGKSSISLSRRQFLTLAAGVPLVALAGRLPRVSAGTQSRRLTYIANVGLLYETINFRVDGTIDELVDRAAGRYEVRETGEGNSIANRVESTGRLVDGRWTPDRAASWFSVRGRESRSEILYDHGARRIHYQFRGETFFLRRLRVVEDTVVVPDGVHVDDVMSALLNYAGGQWKPDPDGTCRTRVVRRRRRDGEGVDEVEPHARAELVPFELSLGQDRDTGKPAAFFDMTRFSSWAREGRPARIVFTPARRPELITSSLILGTSITIRLREV